MSIRNIVKSALLKWKVEFYCFQETKVSKGVENIAKKLWPSRWMRYGYIEADRSRGGILIMWDCRIWTWSTVENWPILYYLQIRCSTKCLYLVSHLCLCSPHLDWETRLLARGGSSQRILRRTRVTCGDFNTVRVMAERRRCNWITNVMSDFIKWIEEMELHDPH